MIKKFILLAAPFLMTACASHDEFDTPVVLADNVIEIGTYISKTRANVKETFVDGDEIMLNACRTTGDYSNTFTPNHMDKVKVTRMGGQWTYSPLVTWPTDENEHISFTAFYPYTNDATATAYNVNVTDEYARTFDPLWCTIRDAHIHDRNGKAINGSEEEAGFEAASGSINLKFKHLLSKVNVKVKLNEGSGDTNCWLNALNLNNVYSIGTFTYANDLTTGTWLLKSSKDYSLFTEIGKSDEEKKVSSTAKEIETLMLLPQNLGKDGHNVNFSIKYTYELSEGGTKEVEKTIYLPDEWELNKSYNYTIFISLDTSTITVNAEVLSINETEEYIPYYEAPETVDLDLPSGTLWAKYDYGTSDYMEDGATYNWTGWSDFNTSIFGQNWAIPKEEEWKELISNCEKSVNDDGTVKFASKSDPEKYIMFKPGSGYWAYTYYHRYSSSSGVTKYMAMDMISGFFESDTSYYYPIRLVCKKQSN